MHSLLFLGLISSLQAQPDTRVLFGTAQEIGREVGEEWDASGELRDVEFAIVPKGADNSEIRWIISGITGASWTTTPAGRVVLGYSPFDLKKRMEGWSAARPIRSQFYSSSRVERPASAIVEEVTSSRGYNGWWPGRTFPVMLEELVARIGVETLSNLRPDRAYVFSYPPAPGETPIPGAEASLEKFTSVERTLIEDAERRAFQIPGPPGSTRRYVDDLMGRVLVVIAPGHRGKMQAVLTVYGRSGRVLGYSVPRYVQGFDPYLSRAAPTPILWKLRPDERGARTPDEAVRGFVRRRCLDSTGRWAMVVEPRLKASLWVAPPRTPEEIQPFFGAQYYVLQRKRDWILARPGLDRPLTPFRISAATQKELLSRGDATVFDQLRKAIIVGSLSGWFSVPRPKDVVPPKFLESPSYELRGYVPRFLATLSGAEWDQLVAGKAVPVTRAESREWFREWALGSRGGLKWDRPVPSAWEVLFAPFPGGIPADSTIRMVPESYYVFANAEAMPLFQYVRLDDKGEVRFLGTGKFDIVREQVYRFEARLGSSGAMVFASWATGERAMTHQGVEYSEFPEDLKQQIDAMIDARKKQLADPYGLW